MPLGRGSPPFAYIAFGRAWREDAFRRMPPEIFCMAGGHTGAQSSSFRVRMDFLRRFGKSQAHSPPYAPGKGLTPFLCVAFGRAWREGTVRRMPQRFSAWQEGARGRRPVASVCVWTFCSASARARPILAAMPPGDSRSAVPFCMGCPLHTGARRKKIPYPVSFGIRHFEKGVNERGNQPCQPICASTNRHT